MSRAGALNLPVPVRVLASVHGEPREVEGREIELVRESWLIEDRWWTAAPLRRRYWELVGALGQNMVVFHDLSAMGRSSAARANSGDGFDVGVDARGSDARGGWFRQKS